VNNDLADCLSSCLVSDADALAAEFERRLADSSTLAFRVAYSVLRHRQDAEDVAQEAFGRAHRAFRKLRDRDRFRAWLVRMTWRLAMDQRRGQMRRTAREETAVDPVRPPSAEDALIAGERSAQLWRAIDELPQKLRIALVLSAIEGHSVREVAVLLNVADGTVKSRLFDARRRLQEKLTCTANPSTTR
jgi:RNA polymerase sigma-70 factor (ECF subfamily)